MNVDNKILLCYCKHIALHLGQWEHTRTCIYYIYLSHRFLEYRPEWRGEGRDAISPPLYDGPAAVTVDLERPLGLGWLYGEHAGVLVLLVDIKAIWSLQRLSYTSTLISRHMHRWTNVCFQQRGNHSNAHIFYLFLTHTCIKHGNLNVLHVVHLCRGYLIFMTNADGFLQLYLNERWSFRLVLTSTYTVEVCFTNEPFIHRTWKWNPASRSWILVYINLLIA